MSGKSRHSRRERDFTSSQGLILLHGARILTTVLMLLVMLPRGVRGAGTPAGTVIPYQASATYSSPGWTSPAIAYSNTIDITVAQVAVVNLAPLTAEGESRVDAFVEYPLTITNSGNGSDRFAVTATSALGIPAAVYWDMDGDGILDSEEFAAGPIGETRTLPADSSLGCVVRLQVPPDVALIGQTDRLVVSAVSAFDGAGTAQASRSTRIIGAAMALVKGVSIPQPRAGDRVTYSIAYKNTGNAEATNGIVIDELDPRLHFVSGGGARAPDNVAGQTLTWNLGPVQGGEEGSIAFVAEIVSSAVPGDEVHNRAMMHYRDGPNTRNAESVEASFVTIQTGGTVTVDVSPSHAKAGQPGDTIQYVFAVTNRGIFPEDFALSTSSSLGLDWLLYQDLNANWKTDPGEPVATTGAVQPGGVFTVIARTTLPRVTEDLTRDLMTLRAASRTNINNANAAVSTTTILLPRMTLAKQAVASDPRTGHEIVYTVTYANEGNGQADGFAVRDALPPHTAFVPGSVRLNGTAKTEQADGDGATLQDGVLTVQVGTVMPGARGVVEFRVRIL